MEIYVTDGQLGHEMASSTDCHARDEDFLKVLILRCPSSGIHESNDRVTDQKHGLRIRDKKFGQQCETGAFGVLILVGFFRITVLTKQFFPVSESRLT